MREKHKTSSLLGKWNPIVGLLSSPIEPLVERKAIIEKLNEAAHDFSNSELPDLESWRSLADGMNLLQSLAELNLIYDAEGVIDDVKSALLESFENYKTCGKLHMRESGIENARTLVVNMGDLLEVMSARIYWSAVRRTEKRIQSIWDGHKNAGDVVVSL